MVLFFGIAAKEVTESCLPGGSLNPPRKALAPLIATVGGVAGPVAVYAITTALFHSAGQQRLALVATEPGVVAGIDLRTGGVAWRSAEEAPCLSFCSAL